MVTASGYLKGQRRKTSTPGSLGRRNTNTKLFSSPFAPSPSSSTSLAYMSICVISLLLVLPKSRMPECHAE
jgi:hypothetical protein